MVRGTRNTCWHKKLCVCLAFGVDLLRVDLPAALKACAVVTGVAEITVNATAPDDKVDEIRLFHNGKAVNLATRGVFVVDADGTDTKKYVLNLLPGNNNFRVIALNSQYIESEVE